MLLTELSRNWLSVSSDMECHLKVGCAIPISKILHYFLYIPSVPISTVRFSMSVVFLQRVNAILTVFNVTVILSIYWCDYQPIPSNFTLHEDGRKTCTPQGLVSKV